MQIWFIWMQIGFVLVFTIQPWLVIRVPYLFGKVFYTGSLISISDLVSQISSITFICLFQGQLE